MSRTIQATVVDINDHQVHVRVRRNHTDQVLKGTHPDLAIGDKINVKRVVNDPRLHRAEPCKIKTCPNTTDTKCHVCGGWICQHHANGWSTRTKATCTQCSINSDPLHPNNKGKKDDGGFTFTGPPGTDSSH